MEKHLLRFALCSKRNLENSHFFLLLLSNRSAMQVKAASNGKSVARLINSL